MNSTWLLILSAVLVIAGVLAEMSLFRRFLRDWLGGRKSVRRKSAPAQRTAPTPIGLFGVERRLTAALMAVAACGGSLALAPTQARADTPEAPPEQTVASLVAFQLNLDYTNTYFYRGIIQENTGLILQPAAKLTAKLFERDSFKIEGILGSWNSLHGQKTNVNPTHNSSIEHWYECDFTAGLTLTENKFSLTTAYVALTSPANSFARVQELDFTFAYDDTELLGACALHPYAVLAVELGANGSDSPDLDRGTYLELGIAPGFTFDVGKTPVYISFPASVGLSLQNYYQDAGGGDSTFGFAQIGVKASVPLPIDDRFGKWTLNAGISAVFLGDHTSQYFAGRRQQIVGTIGLQINF